MAIAERVQRPRQERRIGRVRTTAPHHEPGIAQKQSVADIKIRLCQDLDWSMTRNGVDFNMSMPDWEEKCRRIGENPTLWVS